jgi:hypothetical protein
VAVASLGSSRATVADAGATAAPHRMADAAVRLRTAVVAAVLLAVAWAAVSLVGHPSGFFTDKELPYVSGLPIAPPQIERRLAPQAPAGVDLSGPLGDLQNSLSGGASPPPSP